MKPLVTHMLLIVTVSIGAALVLNFLRSDGIPLLRNVTSHDFGEVLQGQEVPYTFTYPYQATQKMVIDDIDAACGCTAVTPEKQSYLPGKSSPSR